MDNARVIRLLGRHYGNRLKHWYGKRDVTHGEARALRSEYERRFYDAMDEADFGPDNGRFSSYANCLSGIVAYAMARERGLSMGEGIACYDYLAKPLRGFARWMWGVVDRLPNGFELVTGSVRDDLVGPKGVCWQTEIVRDDDERFEYRCHACLYYDICCARGYPEAIQLFCNHDHHAWDGLHRHVRFVRYGGVGEMAADGILPDGLSSSEPGCLCHDAFLRIGAKRSR